MPELSTNLVSDARTCDYFVIALKVDVDTIEASIVVHDILSEVLIYDYVHFST